MEYEAFRNVVLEELKDFYGKDTAAITISDMQDAAGHHFDGIDILMQDGTDRGSHAINLSVLYEKYTAGRIDIYDCVESIYREREGQEIPIKAPDNL